MSAALIYWEGDAYAFDTDGELVALHNVGDVRVIGGDA